MPEHTCSTCHWWTAAFAEQPRRVCVLLNGLKTVPAAPVTFGGSKPLQTVADFGCTRWEADRREKNAR